MMETIGERMLEGAGVAAWIIGFIALLGLFAGLVTLFCMAMSYIMGQVEAAEGREENDHAEPDAKPAGERAPAVLREYRQGLR